MRTTAEPSLDVHRVEGGQARTIVVPVASADLSVRIVGGQRSDEIARNLEQLLRDALPDGAELIFSAERAEASAFDPETPALQAARRALERAGGREPTLCRTGGTLPILAAFAERGIPAIVSGFSLPDDALHAPNESYRLVALEQGEQAARALYEELAGLRVSELEQALDPCGRFLGRSGAPPRCARTRSSTAPSS